LDRNLGYPLGHVLARAKIERHSLPAPVIDVKFDRRVRRSRRIFANARLFPIADDLFAANPAASVLPPYRKFRHYIRCHGAHRTKEFSFLVAGDVSAKGYRRNTHLEEKTM